ncbi:DSD1 family PLP-dependent enzyme [Phenylobacterium sp.]|uniref:DSD1 family PLP-dependent enzyme n=1 Tax=Phenylobacterium sp. TaxID=1871053 RepID=UPI002E2FC65C|nr:DSD1 family PLP-dependent enzyme [Phenylobacterium sp.]HEX2561377.1 DSD1 family PLP-dependent enzyme [Phenylobacterium sp.]
MSESADWKLHGHLIGRQGSRRSLNTPALVLDLEALDANIATMAGHAAEAGVNLRPHAKTHKSVDIAKRQIAAGAVGQCCAKLGEAEALADGGVSGILITSPVVSAPAVERLVALNARCEGLMVTADHPDAVDALARAAQAAGQTLSVVVDVDPGLRRTGVASAADAVALAMRIQGHSALRYAGVQFYCGSQQHIESFAERRAAIEERTAYLRSVLDALAQAGAPAPLVTGGGTGTHRIDLELGVFTELQVGSYVFMDRQYLDCDLTGADAERGAPYRTSLMVDARVVSANAPGLATVDAGFKAFATDGGPPPILSGADGARYAFMGDEHGAVIGPERTTRLPLDSLVTFAVPHCDPTVNLYDSYHVVRDDTLVDIWPITARGRSR